MEETKQWLVKVLFKSFQAKFIEFAQDLSICNGRSKFWCFAVGVRFSWSSILIASCVAHVNSITSHSRLSGHRRVCARPSPRGHIFGHRTCILVNISFFRLACRMAPCNWMRWRHNDIGRWQKAAEHEAEHCLVRCTGDALVSEVCPTPLKDVRVSKEEAEQYHSTLPPSMWSEMSLAV